MQKMCSALHGGDTSSRRMMIDDTTCTTYTFEPYEEEHATIVHITPLKLRFCSQSRWCAEVSTIRTSTMRKSTQHENIYRHQSCVFVVTVNGALKSPTFVQFEVGTAGLRICVRRMQQRRRMKNAKCLKAGTLNSFCTVHMPSILP